MTSKQQQPQYPPPATAPEEVTRTTSAPTTASHHSTAPRTTTSLAHTQGTSYGRSFSGSETDVSTSTENLSPEERYALAHTQRQEPQGQEENVGGGHPGTTTTTAAMAASHHSQASDLATTVAGLSITNPRSHECNASISSSTNTLIIHNSASDDPWHHRWMPGGYSTPMASRKSLSQSLLDSQDGVHQLNMESLKLNSSLLNSSVLPSSVLESSAANSNVLSSSLLNSSILDSSMLTQKTSVPSYLSQSSMSGSSKLSASAAMGYQPSTDLPDIPSSYLDQSEVLKHLLRREGKGSSDQSASSSNSGINLMSEHSHRDLSQMPLYTDLEMTVNYDLLNLPPPPAYPMWRLKDSAKSGVEGKGGEGVCSHTREKSSLSKSQPDLSKLNNAKETTSPKELLSQRVVSGQQDSGENAMEDILAHENNALKMEVDLYHRKLAKLQRFELEMLKVHEAHEALVRSSERREQLERLARHKLHAEVKKISDINAELREQLQVATSGSRSLPSSRGGEAEVLRKELNKRDVFIAQLISQNKELIAAKERQEMELTAQRQTLNEQRTHIDILDSALTNAQANVVRLEEELRKKHHIVEQVGQLKRVLVTMQLAGDKREQSERSLRHKLEKEIQHLRMGSREEAPGSKISDLRREVRDKEEKIMILEGEVTKWEQRYLQESAMRQLAIEAAAAPKDVKLSAIEKANQESERSFSQLKAEKLRQMDELQSMNKKHSDYEARNRELESYIAERDAMIRVLQRRVEEKEVLYQKALVINTLAAAKRDDGRSNSSNTSLGHSSQASTIHSHSGSGGGVAGSGGAAPPTPRRDEELAYLGPELHSRSSLSRCRELSSEQQRRERSAELVAHHQAAALDSPGSDDLLVDNEDGMLGKLRVLCFPGLVNPGSTAGEGTVPQSLLAGVELPFQRSTFERSTLPSYDRSTRPSLERSAYPSFERSTLERSTHPLFERPSNQSLERSTHLSLELSTHPSLERSKHPSLDPSNDLSLLGSHLGLPRHIDLPTSLSCPSYDTSPTCPPYDALPSYTSDPCAPPPPPRDQSSLGGSGEGRSGGAGVPRGNPPPYYSRHELLTQQPTAPASPYPSDVTPAPPYPTDSTSAPSYPTDTTPAPPYRKDSTPAPPYSTDSTPAPPYRKDSTPTLPYPMDPPPAPPYPRDQAASALVPGNLNANITRKMAPSTPNLSMDVALPRPSMCRNPHHPTVSCRKCNSVRSSNRQNAAILVRRANSSAGHGNRKSAPPPCQADADTDDTPSILARLRQEWEMGNIPPVQTQSQPKNNTQIVNQSQQPQASDTSNGNKTCKQNEQLTNEAIIIDKNEQVQHTIQLDNAKSQDSPSLSRKTSTETAQESSVSVTNANVEGECLDSNSNSFAHPISTARQSLTSRVRNLFTTPLQLPDMSQSKTVTITTVDKESHTESINNRTVSQDLTTQKNDLNQLNNNKDDKIELIILEDSDKLKTPQDITKPLKDVI